MQLDPNQRGGILTHGSVLTLTSYPVRTSPVLRGKYILDVILGSPPPPPPADVPALNEDKAASPGVACVKRSAGTGRTRSARRATAAWTRSASGWRTTIRSAGGARQENKSPIAVGGTLPNGAEFTTPSELKLLLTKELPEFTRNLTEKMLTYALGRGLEGYDKLLVRETVAKMEKSDYKFQTLVREIVEESSVPGASWAS